MIQKTNLRIIPVILFFLTAGPIFAQTNDNDLNEMLTAMAYDGGLEYVKALLDDGAEINYIDKAGKSALHWAVEREHVAVVDYLLEQGADPNIKAAKDSYTPLHLATKMQFRRQANRIKIIKLLLAHKADPNALDNSKVTPLHLAAFRGYDSACKLLIKNGADVTAGSGFFQLTPLHEAAKGGHADIVKMLIEGGSDVNYTGRKGWTPLHTAQNADVAAILIENGADINAVSNLGFTPLSEAVEKGKPDTIKILIAAGADAQARVTDRRRSLLHFAKNRKIAEQLVSLGLDVNAADTWGYTPLHMATANNRADAVKYLVEQGADINAKIRHKIFITDLPIGSTPLDVAKKVNPDSKIVAYLSSLKAKSATGLPAKLYYEDFDPAEPPIFRAVRSGNYTMVTSLLKSGADANQKDEFGWAPVHWAAQFGRIETLKLLLKNGAGKNDVTVKTMSGKLPRGSTPLDIATFAGKTDMMNFLSESGAKRSRDLTIIDRLLGYK